jgi:predicted unusual protein kinase regulating ubiquinone biosynthesis (AarF/ABC1/UbiB family)
VELVKTSQESGALQRGFRIGKLGFGLVGSYIGYQAQNLLLSESGKAQRRARFQQKASQRVSGELGALKGAAMKLGQLLSMQSRVFPEEALRELAALQMHAPGMHATMARAQFKASMGKFPEDVFRQFDPEPFAAASLGQVHRAVTRKGEKVAVKIQYPAIRSAIENDFKVVRSAMFAGQLTGHLPAALFDEVQRGIMEETDYVNEAKNLKFFREHLADIEWVTIPRVYEEFSSDRTLTMSFVEGRTLSGFLEMKPSQQLRDLIGARLVELFEVQCHLKALHADPHPGNYLFQPNGSIGMIDFGCVKRFSLDWRELRRFYDEWGWRESEAAARRFLKILCGPKAPYEKARKILPDLEEWLELWHPRGSGDYFFGQKMEPARKKKLEAAKARTARKIFQNKLIEPEYVFLSRADTGICFLLEQLEAVVNISEIERRIEAGQETFKAIAS